MYNPDTPSPKIGALHRRLKGSHTQQMSNIITSQVTPTPKIDPVQTLLETLAAKNSISNKPTMGFFNPLAQIDSSQIENRPSPINHMLELLLMQLSATTQRGLSNGKR